MFGPITLPFGAKMLFNTVKLKPGVTFDDVEMAVGEMCSVVKETYGGDKGGFIAGQVFKFSGFVSDEGSLGESRTADDHYAIVTYWHSFENHENPTPTKSSQASLPPWSPCVPRPRNSGTTCSGKARQRPEHSSRVLSPAAAGSCQPTAQTCSDGFPVAATQTRVCRLPLRLGARWPSPLRRRRHRATRSDPVNRKINLSPILLKFLL